MISLALKTPQDIRKELAARFKSRRLHLNLSQEGLAQRAGVSLGSLKRFERTGQISLESLLRLSLALDCLMDFDHICPDRSQDPTGASLDDILRQPTSRKKGWLK
jgi:transcriptional regulator with XRE-family HTH domain